MRKTRILAAMCVAALSMTACSGGAIASTKAASAAVIETTAAETTAEPSAEIAQNQTDTVAAAAPTTEAAATTGSNILVAYFTRAENIGDSSSVDAVSSASINAWNEEIVGNMRAMAEVIQEQTDGDIFSIQTERTYSQNYRQSTNEAREELNSNARPALKTHVEDMSRYDVVYIGYPNWWGTIPTAVSTFLEEYDFTGKTIIPFASHEGSGLGSGVSAIRELCPGATLLDGFSVRGSRATEDSTKSEIETWLREIGQKE